ncbi:MAG: DNA recombination protein RmuC [Gammaproteobacteria bacterium]|nr:DNA recombination protein RmuC [Gammaproteobacteria bacterium]
MNIDLWIGIVIGLLAGGLFAAWRGMQLKHQHSLERSQLEAKITAQTDIAHQFSHLSAQALKNNNDNFLKLAEENFRKHEIQAKHELDKKEKSIEELLKPVKEALVKTEIQLREIEKDRKHSLGAVEQHLKSVAESQARLQQETRNLVNALRKPQVRGQWGEATLKRIAELSGMVEYCDFHEQISVDSEQGRQRPDMIVRMPDQRELIVDAKTPLDAYLSAIEAQTDADKQTFLLKHASNIRSHIKSLASKSYWSQFKNSPDYVILFIPGEQFLSAALEQDYDLMDYALSNRVILATPTTLIALLRAVAFGWRQQAVAANAEHIQQLGVELYNRLSTFTGHLSKLGRQLRSSVESYNNSVGSLENSVLPGARKFTELGVEQKKSLEDLSSIDITPRSPISNLSVDDEKSV